MIEQRLDLKQSEIIYQDLINNGFSFNDLGINDEYKDLRQQLVKAWEESKQKVSKIKSYDFDLELSLRIYVIFSTLFDKVSLASYDFWRYISLRIIPDLLYERWGNSPLHFYKKTVRIYPYTLFWYIKLSWQGSVDSTKVILSKKFLTTDTILQVVERPGTKGVDLNYYKNLLVHFCSLPEKSKLPYGDILRKVLTLNTSRSFNLVIDYYDGGTIGYVSDLFDDVLGGDING